MKILIDIPEHQYNNIVELSSISIGRVPYKGIIINAINAIKQGASISDNATRAEVFEKIFGAKIDPKHGDYDLFCFAHTGCDCGDCPLKKILDDDSNKWCSTAYITWWESPFTEGETHENKFPEGTRMGAGLRDSKAEKGDKKNDNPL